MHNGARVFDGVCVEEGVIDAVPEDVLLEVCVGVLDDVPVGVPEGVFEGVGVGVGLRHCPSGSTQRVPTTEPPRGQL